jgi:hypothetical protein
MFFPLIFFAMMAYVAWMIIQGFRSGTMEALSRGMSLRAERRTEPLGFWSATLWNVAWIGLCLWGAVGSTLVL